jgi:pimeloyl-ACP methyl ester carboxylesterase
MLFTSFLLWTVMFATDSPSHFATLDGMRVHYISFGSGKEAIIFIHGWACDLTFWRLQAPVYQNRCALLVDLPGHGQSDKPDIPYTQDLFARAVEAVMRDARVDKAILVGHSMGVPVALTFLSKFPEKVEALVIVDGFMPMPPGSKEEEKKREAEAAEEIKSYRSPDYKTIVESDIDSMFSPQTSRDLREEIRSKMLSTPQHVLASADEGMMALAPLNTKVEKPTFAIFAIMEGQNLSPVFEQYIREMVLNLEIQKWDDAGHFLMMEQPERFNRALLDFLRKLGR